MIVILLDRQTNYEGKQTEEKGGRDNEREREREREVGESGLGGRVG